MARCPRPQKCLPPGPRAWTGGGRPRRRPPLGSGPGPGAGWTRPVGVGEGWRPGRGPGGAQRSVSVAGGRGGGGVGGGGVVPLGLGVSASSLCVWRARDELWVSRRMGSGARAPKGLGADVSSGGQSPRSARKPPRRPPLGGAAAALGGSLHGSLGASEPQFPDVRRKGSGYTAF